MEKTGVGSEILKTGEISSIMEALCKLKNSGNHIKNSIEVQKNMSSSKFKYYRQKEQRQQIRQPIEEEIGGSEVIPEEIVIGKWGKWKARIITFVEIFDTG